MDVFQIVSLMALIVSLGLLIAVPLLLQRLRRRLEGQMRETLAHAFRQQELSRRRL